MPRCNVLRQLTVVMFPHVGWHDQFRHDAPNDLDIGKAKRVFDSTFEVDDLALVVNRRDVVECRA